MTNQNPQQPPGTPNSGKPRKRKATYMLPPHEAAELRQISAAKKARKSLPKNPMTNKQKMAVAEASKREAAERLAAKGFFKTSVEEGKKNPSKQPLGGPAKPKTQFVWPCEQQRDKIEDDKDHKDDSNNDSADNETDDDDSDEEEDNGEEKEVKKPNPPRQKSKDEDRVLFRPTHRTKKLKEMSRAARPRDSLAPNGIFPIRKVAETKVEQKVFGQPDRDSIDAGAFFSHLPAEIREKIWGLCVVDPDFFVWPKSKTGAEQPDLAMTCRDIRDEVLPIYYSQNIFAIDITPAEESSDDATFINVKVPGKVVFNKWAGAVEVDGWFDDIRNWVFSYTPSTQTSDGSNNVSQDSFVSVQVDQKDGIWFAKSVEVHRDAACLLPGREEYGRCVVQKQPDWLVQSVVQMLDAGRKRDINPKMVRDLLVEVARHSPELGIAVCRAPGQQVEKEPRVINLDE